MLEALNDKSHIKLVAIAKDEAPYLAEWVYHHLYFGFKSIEILVNRTSDCSYDILENISRKHPNVKFRSIDWIDMAGADASRRLQAISYALLIEESRKNQDCSSVLFLDVDEFWTPLDMRSSISDCVEELGSPEVLSFEWGNSIFEAGEFSIIPDKLTLWLSGMVKSLVSVNVKIDKIRLHVPVVESGVKHYLADGTSFAPSPENPQSLKVHKRSLKKYIILHRMYRSEKEYLSNLFRGNPESSSGIKLNRNGYNAHKDLVETCELNLSRMKDYKNGFIEFIESCCLRSHLDRAIKDRALNYQRFIKFLPVNYLSDPKKVKNILRGVTDDGVVETVSYLDSVIRNVDEEIEKKCGNNIKFNFIRDVAINFEEKGEVTSAYYAMKRAHYLKPNGPLINKKLNYYANLLSK